MIKLTKIGMRCASKLPLIKTYDDDDDCFYFEFPFKAISLNRYIALHRMTRMKLRRLEALIIASHFCAPPSSEGHDNIKLMHALRNEILSPTDKTKEKAKAAKKELKAQKSAILDVLKKKQINLPPLCKPMPFAEATSDDGTANKVCIAFTHRRRRLLDIDNYVTKHLLDTFVRVGLLDCDDPHYLAGVIQYHIKTEKGDPSPDKIGVYVYAYD